MPELRGYRQMELTSHCLSYRDTVKRSSRSPGIWMWELLLFVFTVSVVDLTGHGAVKFGFFGYRVVFCLDADFPAGRQGAYCCFGRIR
ncbi:hypothetical protein [Cohnella kolymensis]|uniref:hypothetical protein n=1 Tax=Cohnella kolymensis TaxID=1590652 RepID=UPI0013792AB8|nr:hypothetical protein [Cohnella kolymensis]